MKRPAKLVKKQENFFPPSGRSHKDDIDEARFYGHKTCFKGRHLKKAFMQWEAGLKVTSKRGALEVGKHIDAAISSHYGFNV